LTAALVTGATGCLGRHLVEELVEAGTSVRALVRDSSRTDHLQGLGIEVVRGSLVDEHDLARSVQGMEVVFHLGGVVVDDPGDTSEALWQEIKQINVDGTELLARKAAAAGARRLVFCSSARIYGFGGQMLWDEDGPRSPSDLYARGKELAEQGLEEVTAETGLEVVSIRPRFIYGDHDRHVLPPLVSRVRRGRAPFVASDAICDIVYVRDCVQALMLAAERPVAGNAFNVTSGECLSMREILSEVARALGVPMRLIGLPAPLLTAAAAPLELGARLVGRRAPFTRAQLRWVLNDHHLSIARARKELGYRPRYRLREALRDIDLEQFLAYAD
jgi:nucleoside-diphosphate-sugar epimerase